jgi:hypothetical protein
MAGRATLLAIDSGQRSPASSRMRSWFEAISPNSHLSRGGRLLLLTLGTVFLVFCVITVHRAALQDTRKGDLNVYLRAAWAARSGESMYHILDDHGWHYNYLPLLASVLIPLADPPAEAPATARAGILPYWLSVTIWYWLSIACLIAAVHVVASALEATTGPPRRFSQVWWAMRVLPILVTLFFIGDGIGRGQVTPMLMLLLAGSGAAILRGQSLRAGFWLGFAIMLKLFPAYLLIYPLWRRDKRFIAGAAASMLIGFLIPFATMGPSAGFAAYREFVDLRLFGEAARMGDPMVKNELYGTNSRIQGFQYIIYDTLHPDRETRLPQPPMPYLLAHIALSGLFTAGALWAMRRRGDPLGEFLAFAALSLLMIPILPVSRMHYYALGALAFAGLYAAEWRHRRGLWAGWPVAIAGTAFVVTGLLDAMDNEVALEFGFATYAALAVVYLALRERRRRSLGFNRAQGAPQVDEDAPRPAKALDERVRDIAG